MSMPCAEDMARNRERELQQIKGIGPVKAAAIAAAERRGGQASDAHGVGRVLAARVYAHGGNYCAGVQ